MGIGKRLYVNILLLTVTAFAISCSSIYFTRILPEGAKTVPGAELSGLSQASEALTDIQASEKYFYRYLYGTGAVERAASRGEYQTAREEALRAIEGMESAAAGEDLDQIQELTALADSGFAAMEELMQLADNGADSSEIQAQLPALAKTMDAIDGKMEDLYGDGLDAVEASAQEMDVLYGRGALLMTGLAGLLLLFAAITASSIHFGVVRPLKETVGELKTLITGIRTNQTDLSQRLPVRSRDEIGELAAGVNHFIEILQEIMQRIGNTSSNIQSTTDTINEIILSANRNSNSISAVARQLSASMETVASTTGSLELSARELLESITNAADETAEGSSLVEDIRTSASDVRMAAQRKRAVATQELAEKRVAIEESSGKARKVERITPLADHIHDLATKTHLLALNAAIEAVREGDGGRRFAMVAEEIRNLADGSQQTADSIHEISLSVTGAVKSLTDNSNRLLTCMEDRVSSDYTSFEHAAEAYCRDAGKMKEIVDLFSDNMDAFKSTTEEITGSLGTISDNISKCSIGVSESSESISTLVDSISEIRSDTQENYTKIQNLNLEISKFQ